MEEYTQKIVEMVTFFGVKIVVAVLILVVGRWVARGFRKLVNRLMGKNKLDPTIIGFVGNFTYVAILVFFVIAALGQLGIQTASFIAVIGAAGLAVGLALQGSLANFAAGFLMIIFRPISVGDYIEGAGVTGTVEKL